MAKRYTSITGLAESKADADRIKELRRQQEREAKQNLIDELKSKKAGKTVRIAKKNPEPQTCATSISASTQPFASTQSGRLSILMAFVSSEYSSVIDFGKLVKTKAFRRCLDEVVAISIETRKPDLTSTLVKKFEKTPFFKPIAEYLKTRIGMTYLLASDGHASFRLHGEPGNADFDHYLQKFSGSIQTVFGVERIRLAKDSEKSEDLLDSRLVVDGGYGTGKRRKI